MTARRRPPHGRTVEQELTVLIADLGVDERRVRAIRRAATSWARARCKPLVRIVRMI